MEGKASTTAFKDTSAKVSLISVFCQEFYRREQMSHVLKILWNSAIKTGDK